MNDEQKRKMDPREVQLHLANLVNRLEKDPDSLSKHERRLVAKYKRSADLTQSTMKDIEALSSQITQAQARQRSLELQAENYQGTVTALVEEIMDLKLDADETIAAALVPPAAPSAGAEPVAQTEAAKADEAEQPSGANGKHPVKAKGEKKSETKTATPN